MLIDRIATILQKLMALHLMIAIEILLIRLVFIFFIDEGQGLLAIHRCRFSTRTPANHLNYPLLESQLPRLLNG